MPRGTRSTVDDQRDALASAPSARARPADAPYEVLPALCDPLLGLGGGFGEVGRRQVEQEGAVQGGGELDGQDIEVGGAEGYLPQQHPDVRLGDGRLCSGWYGLAAVQGGAGDLAVPG